MTVNEKIIKALAPFGIPVVPDLYEGEEKQYYTFNYADNRAKEFGDDEPIQVVAYMQIHLFLPLDRNYLGIMKRTRKALFEAGFTFPIVNVLTEKENDIRHVIFDCEIEEEQEE